MASKVSILIRIVDFVVLILVFGGDILALFLAREAEKLQDKVKDVNLFFVECSKKRNHNAYVYGYRALYLLLVAHAIATFIGGWTYLKNFFLRCFCSNKHPDIEATNGCLHIWFVLMWVAFGLGMFFLKYGADPNKKSKLSCHLISHRGWLWYGGYLCLGHAICFTIFSGFRILARGSSRGTTEQT
ncbi:unnamed protein product [Cuscuta epithymum]|uniref:Uncharacterized protein n=1 Tax=Cuscuta epithymum TaxID=186058 RepID=A0AAV0CIG1_9ASTE|nr:unnamed protein product [Cuscuta epithymum]